MSRSLQMVNVARLNVKALKSQPEAEQPEAPQGAARRCSERKKRGEAPAARRCSRPSAPEGLEAPPPSSKGLSDVCAGFSSEAALLAHLSSAYDSALSGSQPGLPAAAQLLLSAVKAFFGTEQVRGRVWVAPEPWFRRSSPEVSAGARGGLRPAASAPVQQKCPAGVLR